MSLRYLCWFRRYLRSLFICVYLLSCFLLKTRAISTIFTEMSSWINTDSVSVDSASVLQEQTSPFGKHGYTQVCLHL